jgi:hypothetical protein
MNKQISISVENGKYTFKTIEGDYRIHVLRFGEPWLVFEQGNKALICLLNDFQELQEKNSALHNLCIGDIGV